jgi:plastocyanin
MHALLLSLLLAAPPKAPAEPPPPPWLGEKMPLPLAVQTPEDLAFKTIAEKQYLEFNLLASGKVAWDKGDFATAAEKWEALLRMPNLPAELDTLVRPLVKAARDRAGGAAAAPLPVATETSLVPGVTMMTTEPEAATSARQATAVVKGVIMGGGSNGPGGAVVFLRRADGTTPRPRATRVKAVVQKDKRFVPHVLAVPVGATVEFRNDDEIFHNVFSLSKPNDFDLGLYKSGAAREQVFKNPGPVNLLCNIHSAMGGYVYVVPSPWFGQADATGRFAIKNVPEGKYVLEIWHEHSSKGVTADVTVAVGMADLSFTVDGDKRAPAFVPDKAGKPRQPQLGY